MCSRETCGKEGFIRIVRGILFPLIIFDLPAVCYTAEHRQSPSRSSSTALTFLATWSYSWPSVPVCPFLALWSLLSLHPYLNCWYVFHSAPSTCGAHCRVSIVLSMMTLRSWAPTQTCFQSSRAIIKLLSRHPYLFASWDPLSQHFLLIKTTFSLVFTVSANCTTPSTHMPKDPCSSFSFSFHT